MENEANNITLTQKEKRKMLTIELLFVFIMVLSSLYLADRLFNVIRCFIKGEKFEQKLCQRIVSFLALASLITLIIV